MQTLPRSIEFAVLSDTGLTQTFRTRMRAVIHHLAILAERRRQIRRLAQLEDHLLDDIGLTRSDVARECAKPFWRT